MQIVFNWSCGRKSALEIGPEYQKITAAVGVNQPSIEAFFLDGCLYNKRNPFHCRAGGNRGDRRERHVPLQPFPFKFMLNKLTISFINFEYSSIAMGVSCAALDLSKNKF